MLQEFQRLVAEAHSDGLTAEPSQQQQLQQQQSQHQHSSGHSEHALPQCAPPTQHQPQTHEQIEEIASLPFSGIQLQHYDTLPLTTMMDQTFSGIQSQHYYSVFPTGDETTNSTPSYGSMPLTAMMDQPFEMHACLQESQCGSFPGGTSCMYICLLCLYLPLAAAAAFTLGPLIPASVTRSLCTGASSSHQHFHRGSGAGGSYSSGTPYTDLWATGSLQLKSVDREQLSHGHHQSQDNVIASLRAQYRSCEALALVCHGFSSLLCIRFLCSLLCALVVMMRSKKFKNTRPVFMLIL